MPAGSFDQRVSQGTLGVGIGGPLVKDKAFYFASLDLDRRNEVLSSLVRLDWDVTPTSALMVRGDYLQIDLNATHLSSLALPGVRGVVHSAGGGLLTSLTSSFGAFINEFRGYTSTDQQTLDTPRVLPLGSVTVASMLDGGRTGQAQLQFGANHSLPRRIENQLLELSNEVS